MQNYLEQLNPAQQQAVITTEGASLVIAGAGSGKTRVLTFRIAHLLMQGVPPHRILALTFTNKAAREMKLRIATMVGNDIAQKLWMGTFHSVFARILRSEADKLGYPSSFTIYDTADSKSLIKSIIKQMKLSDKEYKPGQVLGRISSAKNDLVTPAAYARDQHRMMEDQASRKGMVYEIYTRYMRQCYKFGAMDFDDLLLNTNILFRDHPEILQKYQNWIQYILVDEYQDTNYSQYIIIKKLAQKHGNICVVGDDAQSIYSFRGAKIENILNFRNDYPDYQLFKLEQNYRSTQNIVNAANSIIAKNQKQIKKAVFSEKDQGSRIKIHNAYSDIEEGYIVINDIKDKKLKHNYDYQDFAILYRTNAQSRIFEEALRKSNMPYKIYGGLSFYQRKEIKDLLAYCRVTVNPADQEALKRIINYPTRGIGKTTLDKIEAAAVASGKAMWEILISLEDTSRLFNAGTQRKLNSFVGLINGFAASLKQQSAYDLVMEIATQSGMMKDLYHDRTPEAIARQENIQELMNGIQEFSNNRMEEGGETGLIHFLEEVSLLTDQDNESDDDINKVTLMTIHSSKGLEFKNVYIVGVEEGLFPSSMTLESEQGIEEERRLFYVAVTRAEDYATISFARTRYKYGESAFCRPSRFIGEIHSDFVEFSGDKIKIADKPGKFTPKQAERRSFSNTSTTAKPGYNFKKVENRQGGKKGASFSGSAVGNLKAGLLVEHIRFGKGRIISLDGEMPNAKATVDFENAGLKQLLLKFAKLKILG
ncbi:DNA helicase-2 / ATP-dependent DNA helicase PcrA [Saccharicrinis carchari]|uniref:DNA 3'-5' helicase n=1 Tax=Saccharicrinis carchari TaxID=1168039 RepID=A0A521FAE4_SACCC|nr:UvrD-helicase domain-containing protein [Saccharicrinis carchari]SMO93127.1 DNA helicase-2 / ATP-dependent DNA helicase PcrA [Saccharicrinis carchari]